jgi:hypothetical protein
VEVVEVAGSQHMQEHSPRTRLQAPTGGSALRHGTALQTGRSRVQFPTRPFKYSIDLRPTRNHL